MNRDHVALAALLVVLVATLAVAQEVRRPAGRMIATLETLTPTPSVTPTITPTPDPCADCPEPGGVICEMWPDICYQCWEDCGHPIATHTPTPTWTPPAPPPTPTPHGPECELTLPVEGAVYLVAFYFHTVAPGVRYTLQTAPVSLPPGMVARPCPCEGIPVGFKWYSGSGTLLKSCGDTSTGWYIFSDGFESGDIGAWEVEDE